MTNPVRWICNCLILSALSGLAFGATTVDDVIKLSKAGISPDVILSQLAKDNAKFNLSIDDLLKLKQANVPDNVVKAMVSGPSTAPSTAAAPAQPAVAAAPVAEVGVYFKKQSEWAEVLPEVVNWKTGGVLKSIASAGIVKGDVNGNINGQHSRNSVNTPLEFRIVASEGVAITEYQLIRMHENKNEREFRTVTGGVMHVKGGATRDLVPFEGKRVAARTFEVVLPSNLGAGEYGFLPPGAIGASNGSSLGKMYTFRIVE